MKGEIQKCSYNIPEFLLFRQSDDTYKPLLYHATAVKEIFKIRKKKIKTFQSGGVHLNEFCVPHSSVGKKIEVLC